MSEEIKQNIATAVANRKLLWYYTPSQNSAEELEGIFVQRESIAKDAVERIKEGALKDTKHHLLFVGPRGCGKTHLVSLIYHRLMAMKRVSSKLRVAWLNEDEMSPSFLDLLVRIYRALSSAYKDQFEESAMEPVYELRIDDAEVFLRDLIIEKLGKQSLLVIVENLDELMKGLKTKGQMKWRAFIQDTRKCATLATAQKMVPAVKDRKAPFYGTFQVENLEMLSVKEAVELLKKVAVFYKDAELLEYLNTEPGRQRVECLHLLTGGNHRVMIVLAQFVTKDSLEELIELFFKMLNELTPYYQERLRWISAQQRKIINFLCSSRPLKVNAIAKKLFITEQTLSSQLRELLRMGYVRRDKLGRESIYQIAEPLMRMCVEVKENNHREPIKLIIDLLKIWFNLETLLKQMKICRENVSRAYLQKAIETFKEGEFFDGLRGSDDFSEFKKQKTLIELVRLIDDPISRGLMATGMYGIVHSGGIQEYLQSDVCISITKLENLILTGDGKKDKAFLPKALLSLGFNNLTRGNYTEGLKCFEKVVKSANVVLSDRAIFYSSVCHYQLKDYEESMALAVKLLNSTDLDSIERTCVIAIIAQIVDYTGSWSRYANYLNMNTSSLEETKGLHLVLNTLIVRYLESSISQEKLETYFSQICTSVKNSRDRVHILLNCLVSFVYETCSGEDISVNRTRAKSFLGGEVFNSLSGASLGIEDIATVIIDYIDKGQINIELMLTLTVEKRDLVINILGVREKNTQPPSEG